MLLGAGWVVNGDISNFSLPPHQVGTLSVNVHDWKGFIILERVQPPPALWNACLRWLVVLDHHSPEGVGVFCKRPGEFKVRLLFLSRRSICIAAPPFSLIKIWLLVCFAPLAVFPPPLVVLLSLSLLGRKRVSFPMSPSVVIPLARPVRLPPAPPLLWLVVSSSPFITTSSMLISFL